MDERKIAKLVLDFRRIGQMVLDHRGVDATDHEHLISLLLAGVNGGEKRRRPRGTREEREELEELQAPRQRRRAPVPTIRVEPAPPAVAIDFTLDYMRSISKLAPNQRGDLMARVMQPRFLDPVERAFDNEIRMDAAIKETNRLLETYRTLNHLMVTEELSPEWRKELYHNTTFIAWTYFHWFSKQPSDFRIGRERATGSGFAKQDAIKMATRVAARHQHQAGEGADPGWYLAFLRNALLNWHIAQSMRSVWLTAFHNIQNPEPMSMWPGAQHVYQTHTAAIDAGFRSLANPRLLSLSVMGISGDVNLPGATLQNLKILPAYTPPQPTEEAPRTPQPLRFKAVRPVWERFGEVILRSLQATQPVIRIPSLLWPKEFANPLIAAVRTDLRADKIYRVSFGRYPIPSYVVFDPPLRVEQATPKPMFFSLLRQEPATRAHLVLENVVLLDAVNATKAFSRFGRSGVPEERGAEGFALMLGRMTARASRKAYLTNVRAFKNRPSGAFKHPYVIQEEPPAATTFVPIILEEFQVYVSRRSPSRALGGRESAIEDQRNARWGWEYLEVELMGMLPVQIVETLPPWLAEVARGRAIQLPPAPAPMEEEEEEGEPMEDVGFPPFMPYRTAPGEARVRPNAIPAEGLWSWLKKKAYKGGIGVAKPTDSREIIEQELKAIKKQLKRIKPFLWKPWGTQMAQDPTRNYENEERMLRDRRKLLKRWLKDKK